MPRTIPVFKMPKAELNEGLGAFSVRVGLEPLSLSGFSPGISSEPVLFSSRGMLNAVVNWLIYPNVQSLQLYSLVMFNDATSKGISADLPL